MHTKNETYFILTTGPFHSASPTSYQIPEEWPAFESFKSYPVLWGRKDPLLLLALGYKT